MRSLKINFLVLMLVVSGITQAQWVKTSGPNGGFVFDFAVNGSSIFAATGSNGGVFRSDDDGMSWITVNKVHNNYLSFGKLFLYDFNHTQTVLTSQAKV